MTEKHLAKQPTSQPLEQRDFQSQTNEKSGTIEQKSHSQSPEKGNPEENLRTTTSTVEGRSAPQSLDSRNLERSPSTVTSTVNYQSTSQPPENRNAEESPSTESGTVKHQSASQPPKNRNAEESPSTEIGTVKHQSALQPPENRNTHDNPSTTSSAAEHQVPGDAENALAQGNRTNAQGSDRGGDFQQPAAQRSTIDIMEKAEQSDADIDTNAQVSDTGERVLQPVVHGPVGNETKATKPSDADTGTGLKITNQNTELSPSDEVRQEPYLMTGTSFNEGNPSIEEPGRDASTRSEITSSSIRTRSLTFQDELDSKNETSDALDKTSHTPRERVVDSPMKPEDKSVKLTKDNGKNIVDALETSQSPNVPTAEGVPIEEKPKTPPTTPDPAVKEKASAAADPIPYYATPKIMVHKPSQSFQSETSGPRTIDQVLAKGIGEPFPLNDRAGTADSPAEAPVSSVMPRLMDTPTGKGVHKIAKVRKRSLYLRKARNIAARKTILKMTLGRQLALPTKQALRQLANGETIIDEPAVTP
ncbi:hypothetical protein ACLMJK_006823 [Lecanora helva]